MQQLEKRCRNNMAWAIDEIERSFRRHVHFADAFNVDNDLRLL